MDNLIFLRVHYYWMQWCLD